VARSPEQITSSDSSFCRFFLRMLTTSVGRACAKSHEDKFHRTGRFVGSAIGVDGDGVAGGARGYKCFSANPLDRCCLHFFSVGDGSVSQSKA